MKGTKKEKNINLSYAEFALRVKVNIAQDKRDIQGPIDQSFVSLTNTLTVVAKVFCKYIDFFFFFLLQNAKATQFSAKNINVFAIN